MAANDANPTRVLLLKNYPSAASDKLVLESFTSHIQASVPDARLDICYIANGETIPDLHDYRLVILSGGKVNLLADDKPSWALEVLDVVRNLAQEQTGPKLLGICWGHQAVHFALGGKLAWVEDGPRVSVWRNIFTSSHITVLVLGMWLISNGTVQVGVEDIHLTKAGQDKFGDELLVSLTTRKHLHLAYNTTPDMNPRRKCTNTTSDTSQS